MIRVGDSKIQGRGVFAESPFSVGDIIETCHVIVIPQEEERFIEKTIFNNYIFSWEKEDIAFALGSGSLYNYSENPNAEYQKHFDKKQIWFKCIRPIAKGEEITVSYNCDLWFKIEK